MEPFGLFHFLKTFLDSPAAQEHSKTDEISSPSPQDRAENPAEELTETEQSSPSVNAVLEFMDAHERRAKPHRKP